MKIIVTGDSIKLETIDNINSGAINYYNIDFEFDSAWNNLTKVAILLNSKEESGTEIAIIEDSIVIPFIEESNLYYIGVIGYTIDGEIKTKQISTNLLNFWVGEGAGSITTEEHELPPADVWEQYVATMNGILEENLEVKEAIEGYRDETKTYRDETKTYRDETKTYRDETKGYRDETKGYRDEFDNNVIEKTEAFDLNATNKTTDFNNNAIEKTNIVDGIKDDVVDLKNETLGYKNEAKGSADNAKISEDNAKDSEDDAELALSDLLAMLGTTVATLTGGKLTPSQIPDLSINDVFPVADTDEMLELTAQRGDVAIIVVENVVTDTYMLSADDPTILSNWKKLGVSYVANAGHSNTSDNATNSEKINGKRIVGMTESQYASAVLEENTLYAVYPE